MDTNLSEMSLFGVEEFLRNTCNLKDADETIQRVLEQVISSSALLEFYDRKEMGWPLQIMAGDEGRMYFVLTEVSYKLNYGKRRSDYTEIQAIVIKVLDSDYGHMLIRPETLEDKVLEWFKRTEMDFPGHSKFSSRYFCVTKDNSLAVQFLTDSRLDLISSQKEIFMEVRNNILLAKYARIVSETDCASLIGFITKI